MRRLTRRFGDFVAVERRQLPRRAAAKSSACFGANGAGKSTTFRMLCGLLPPSEGSLRVAGFDLRKAAAPARGRIGYMAQKFSLYGDLSVERNLRFFSSVYGLFGARQRRRIDWAVGEFDLAAQMSASARDLPLGFKQRLALACALMHEPEILFLDEPTSGVDPLARRDFWRRINALADSGVTVLVTTHFMEEAEYCDRLAIMAQGSVLTAGAPEAIKAAARTEARPRPDHGRRVHRDDRGGRRRAGAGVMTFASLRRLRGLLRKEFLQIWRDPSSLAIAFLLPAVLLFLFGYGVSLDASNVPLALVVQQPERARRRASRARSSSRRTSAAAVPHHPGGGAGDDRSRGAGRRLAAERFRPPGAVGRKFADRRVRQRRRHQHRPDRRGLRPAGLGRLARRRRRLKPGRPPPLPIALQPRVRFNPAVKSRDFLVPGLIAMIMTLSGALLTALVIAREWERGTMEALMVTRVTVREILVAKLIPYFLLGMGGMAATVAIGVLLFEVPLRGSLAALTATSSLFMLAALGMGLLISTVARSQFVAAQIAIIATFLPAFILSGFVFDINSMPWFVQIITHVVAARYFVAILQTTFLAGDVWSVILPNAAALIAMAAIFLGVARALAHKRLD